MLDKCSTQWVSFSLVANSDTTSIVQTVLLEKKRFRNDNLNCSSENVLKKRKYSCFLLAGTSTAFVSALLNFE
jgi:hypothetical protein